MGLRMIPVIAVEGKEPLVGFNPEKLRAVLGIKQPAQALPPRQVLAAHDQVLAAIQRAVRQIPDTRLMFKTPDRDRSLQEHVWHIFRFAELALLEGARTGTFHLPNAMGSFATEASEFPTSESIARYGDGTRSALRERFFDAPDSAFEQVVETYAGPMRLADMVPWVTSHSSHHLRQIYDLMRRLLDITPDEPLAVEAMPEVTVLEKLW